MSSSAPAAGSPSGSTRSVDDRRRRRQLEASLPRSSSWTPWVPTAPAGRCSPPTASSTARPRRSTAQIDLYTMAQFAQGAHTVYVHGKDAAGNWGPMATGTLIVDRTTPAISGVTTTPNPANLATTVTLNVTATDPANTGTRRRQRPGLEHRRRRVLLGHDRSRGREPALPSHRHAGARAVRLPPDQREHADHLHEQHAVGPGDGRRPQLEHRLHDGDRHRPHLRQQLPDVGGALRLVGHRRHGGSAQPLNAAANMKDAGTRSLAANIAPARRVTSSTTSPTGADELPRPLLRQPEQRDARQHHPDASSPP